MFAPVLSLPMLPGNLAAHLPLAGRLNWYSNWRPGGPRSGAAYPRCLAGRGFTIRNLAAAITIEILLQRYVPESCLTGNRLLKICAFPKRCRPRTELIARVYTCTTFLRCMCTGAAGLGILPPDLSNTLLSRLACLLLVITGRSQGWRQVAEPGSPAGN
jgi:hypothetical protein